MTMQLPDHRHGFTAFATAILVAVAGASAPSADAQEPLKNAGQDDFRPSRLLPPQPAITNPPTISAQQLQGQVTDSELVLGIEINGQAGAYPINMLTSSTDGPITFRSRRSNRRPF